MATYTICHKFMEACCSSKHYLTAKTLLNFCCDNSLRIATDANGLVLEEYWRVAYSDHDGLLANILNIFASQEEITFEKVELKDNTLKGPDLYFTICSTFAYDKKLICDKKNHYKDFPIIDNDIQLIDKNEAPDEIKSIICPVMNITASDKSQISLASGSPNIRGKL